MSPNGGGDGDFVADFPAETLGGFSAGDGGVAGGEPGLLLFRVKNDFGVHGQNFFRHGRHLREEVFWVLVNASKPGEVGGGGDAGDFVNALLVTGGQGNDEGNLVADDEAVGAGHGHAADQGLFDGGDQPEEHEGDENGKHREERAQLAALEIAPDEGKELHGFASFQSWPLSR